MSLIGLVYTTLPHEKAATRLAQAAVEKDLAACANFFPIQSIYRWQKTIEHEHEVVLLFKTKVANMDKLMAFINEHHPYETPAIWFSQVEASDAYFQYI